MKITRNDPVRRRSSPLSILPIIAVLIILGLLVTSWIRSGQQAPQTKEIPIPAEQLGH